MGIFKKADRTMTTLIPFRDYDMELDCLVMTDGTFMDMLRIKTKDLFAIGKEASDYANYFLEGFFNTFPFDTKLVALNFPTNLSKQTNYLNYKYDKTENPLYKDEIDTMLAISEQLERETWNREYFLFYYVSKPMELEEARNKIRANLFVADLAEEIGMDEKVAVLKKMMNKNGYIMLNQH